MKERRREDETIVEWGEHEGGRTEKKMCTGQRKAEIHACHGTEQTRASRAYETEQARAPQARGQAPTSLQTRGYSR